MPDRITTYNGHHYTHASLQHITGNNIRAALTNSHELALFDYAFRTTTSEHLGCLMMLWADKANILPTPTSPALNPDGTPTPCDHHPTHNLQP